MSQPPAAIEKRQRRNAERVSNEDLPLASDIHLFRKIFGLSVVRRAQLAERGIPTKWFAEVADRMVMPKEKLYKAIGVVNATTTRKSGEQRRLDLNESERALAMMVLIGQVDTIVSESGTGDGFDAAAWTLHWLDSPQPALGRLYVGRRGHLAHRDGHSELSRR